VDEAVALAQSFAALVRQRQPTPLDPWLKRATTSMSRALRRFAKGLYEDDDAVKAGVTLPWSTGPVEGHSNRLKRLKRQMFGRASLDLLGRRFVRTPAYEQERSQPLAVAASSRVSNRAWRAATPDDLEGRRGMSLDIVDDDCLIVGWHPWPSTCGDPVSHALSCLHQKCP
jgi:Transposase